MKKKLKLNIQKINLTKIENPSNIKGGLNYAVAQLRQEKQLTEVRGSVTAICCDNV